VVGCKVGFQHLMVKVVREGQQHVPEDVYSLIGVKPPPLDGKSGAHSPGRAAAGFKKLPQSVGLYKLNPVGP
jgi:hypothetical protein